MYKAVATEKPAGRKKLTRSEAARHASLVRWKKESPFAANVMERLAQIRAARVKKGKGGKGKAKGGKGKAAKPKKDARTPQEKIGQNRASVAKQTGMSDLSGTVTRLSVGMFSDHPQETAAYEELTKKGLAKKLATGKVVLTPAGKKWKRAADKGDADGAREALTEGEGKAKEGADKEAAREQKKAEREKARAERAAAREKRKKGKGKKPPADDKEKAAAAAQREKERQEDRAMRLADRAQRQKEHAEDRAQRAKDRAQREKERLADRAQRQKDRAERDAERKKRSKPKLPGGPVRRTAQKDLDMDELTPIIDDMQATIEELEAVAEDTLAEIKAGRRNNSSDQSAINQGYELSMQLCDLFESLGADTGEEEEEEEGEMMGETEGKAYILDGSAVKALDGDRVGAFAVRFGSEAEPDMSSMRDYFTKSTDFWLDAWDRRPMLYHHAMDEDTDDAPRIGTWTKAEVKDEGVWLEGQLDRHHRYYTAIKELVRRGALRLSSDSAPHLVRRATKAGGIHEVTRWPLLAASLTPTPAEPRLTAVTFKALIAELGIDDTTDNPEVQETEGERQDAAKADQDRVRRLLLRSRLLALQE